VDGFKGLQPTAVLETSASCPPVHLPSMPEPSAPARSDPIPSTSSQPAPRVLENPFGPKMRSSSSSSLSKRPRIMSPKALDALKAIVSQSKGFSPVASTSSSTPFDLPLNLSKSKTASTGVTSNPDLARMALLSNFPNTTFSISEASRLPTSGFFREAASESQPEMSQQVVANAVTLEEISADEREISSVFNFALLEPRVELIELPSPEASHPDRS
jgi:hypothetical protein